MYICAMMLLLFSDMESEYDFMDQDDLRSSARCVSIRNYHVHIVVGEYTQ